MGALQARILFEIWQNYSGILSRSNPRIIPSPKKESWESNTLTGEILLEAN